MDKTGLERESAKFLMISFSIIFIIGAMMTFLVKYQEYQKLSGLQISEKNLNFIESMQTQDGSYYFYETCDGVKEDNTKLQLHPWVILAYSALFRKTQNPMYKEAIINEVKTYRLRFTELSKTMTSGEQLNARIWTITQMHKLYELDQDFGIFDEQALLREWVLDTIKYVTPNLRTYYNIEQDRPMMFSIAGRELLLAYPLVKPESEVEAELMLENAKKQIQRAENNMGVRDEVLFEKFGNKFSTDSCWIQLTKLELYDVTGEQNYLNEVKSFFNILQLSDNIDYEELFPMALLPCVESLIELNKFSPSQNYINEAREITQYILDSYLDTSHCRGEFGVLTSHYKQPGKLSVSDTAYLAYLLPQLNFEYKIREK